LNYFFIICEQFKRSLAASFARFLLLLSASTAATVGQSFPYQSLLSGKLQENRWAGSGEFAMCFRLFS